MKLLALLFSCRHPHTTRVFTRTVEKKKEHYVCCIDCGKTIQYPWAELGRIA